MGENSPNLVTLAADVVIVAVHMYVCTPKCQQRTEPATWACNKHFNEEIVD
jgi:hypothetical protein